MRKEFINPEFEVLRFQKGTDVLLTSDDDRDVPGLNNSGYSTGSQSLSRGIFDSSVD